MRVIVTGASSFMGLAAVRELGMLGIQTEAVIRPSSPARGALEEMEHVRVRPCLLEEIRFLAEKTGLKEADAWLHLGWEGAGSANRQNPELQRKNIGYAMESLRTAAALGCGRFLFTGSQAEYGICREPMREDGECHPVSEYGKDKLEVCRRASAAAGALGLTYLHARVFSVYGPGDHPWSLVSSCLRTFSQGGHMELGECTQHWNFLYIEDMARAMAALLGAPGLPAGVYNIAGEDTRVLREFVEQMHRICGGRGTYQYGRRPPNAEGPASLLPDVGKLERAVGWRPEVTFEEGIRRTLAAVGGQAGEPA